MNWGDPGVQAAMIQSVGAIVAASIAAAIAAMIGHQIAGRKQLREKLAMAVADIQFLLAVEGEHCKLHLETLNESNQRRVRRLVQQQGLFWSGRFTPGRVKQRYQIDG